VSKRNKMTHWEKRDLLNVFGVIFSLVVVPFTVFAIAMGTWIPIVALLSIAALFVGVGGMFRFWDWLGRKIFPDEYS
jgi:uncharacterized membrane protein